MDFTLVSTVFNESKRLDQTISDLINQTLQPSEIIITDAGSNDGTYEMLQQWSQTSPIPIVLLKKERCNVAEGRNIAIKAAKYNLIASMDFGCRYHPEWLNSIILPFKDPNVMVVGGAYSVEESDIQTKAAKAAYILSNGYGVNVNFDWFIPSSRSIAYRKEVYDSVGGYCEWLTLAADDLVFGMLLKKKGYKFFVVDKPYASWMRHKSAKAYIKEAYRYGLGEGEARVQFGTFKFTITKKIYRFAFYISLLTALIVLIFFNSISHLLIAGTISAVLLFLGFKHYKEYFKYWLRLKSSKYNFSILVYALYLVGKINTGYIKGYIKGYYYPTEGQKSNAIKLQELLQN
jgi:glycosyltransferase involved in cell wall biosynthesis